MTTRRDSRDPRGDPPLPSRQDAEHPRQAAGPAVEPDGPGTGPIQRFSRLPSAIDLPGHPTDVLIGHLAGPFFVEAGGPDERNERRWISPGQIGINAAGQPIRRSFKGRPDVVLVHLDAEVFRTVVEDVFDRDSARIHLVPKLGESDEIATRLIRLLLRETEQAMPGADLAIDGLSRALIVHALRSHSNLSTPLPSTSPTLSALRLRRVSDFMQASLERPVSLKQLADVAGFSPSHFGRAFRDATGQAPHRFLTALRIARARELLEATDLPIVDIGFRCGFAQASHFANTFHKVVGVPPRDWRRLRRE